MLRIIVRQVNVGSAVHVGGPVDVTFKTFDVELPEVEKYLSQDLALVTQEVVGVEVIKMADGQQTK